MIPFQKTGRIRAAAFLFAVLPLLPIYADDDTTFKLMTDVVPTVDLSTDAASGLISAGAGEKVVEVVVDSSLTIAGGKAEAVLARCGADGVAGKSAASATAALKPGQTRQRVAFRLKVGAIGLYELTFRVHAGDGAVLAEQKTSLAVIPSRDGVGPDDWGIRTELARGKGTAASASLDWLRLAGFSHLRDAVYGQAAVSPAGIDFAALARDRGLATEAADAPPPPTALKSSAAFPETPEKRDFSSGSKAVDEFGWSTAPVSYAQTDLTQAAYLVRTYLLVRRLSSGPLFWYAFRDAGLDPAEPAPHFGLIRSDFSPKASYVAAGVLSATLGRRVWSKDYAEAESARVCAFGTGADAVVAGWIPEVPAASSPIHVALPPGNYLLRDWTGADRPVTIGSEGYDWALGPVPQYLVPIPTN